MKIQLKNSSLASQAVGPPTSSVEEGGSPGFKSIPPQNATTLDSGFPAEQIGVDVSSNASARANTDARVTEGLSTGDRVDLQFETLNPLFDNQGISKSIPKKLGKKMLALTPLGKQLVDIDDSVLGSYSNQRSISGTKEPKKGLNRTYEALIQEAFKPQWWDSDVGVSFENPDKPIIINKVDPQNTNQVRLIEYNFSLFFGLAVQAYESTLVSDQTPFDQYYDRDDKSPLTTLTDQQLKGLEVFQNRGKCINCHGGPEFTNASVRNVQKERLEILEAADYDTNTIKAYSSLVSLPIIYDNGFYNIGVRPILDDLGVGGTEPEIIGSKPLSETRLAQRGEFRKFLDDDPNLNIVPGQRVDVDGSFKASGLRNVELTAPYFHNGGQLTLEQVVDFYARGGDFLEENKPNVPRDIKENNLTPEEKSNLVAFLKSLTDDRVRYEKAPFDHPQLFVPNGHPGDQNSVTRDGNSIQATDQLLEIPAVGRNGGNGTPNFPAVSRLGPPPPLGGQDILN